MAKFIRIVREKDQMEILLNVDCISKIEVRYGVRSKDAEDTLLYAVSLREGLTNPNAIRSYKIFVGSETFLFPGEVDDPVISVIQEIYRNAIRTPEPHDLPPNDTGDGFR